MRLKHYFISAAMALLSTMAMEAQQPYGGCWFPDDVINWSPETDVDAKFNRSRIPLQERIDNHYGSGQVETATITNKMCSLTPSQGDNNFLTYQPTYWQYMEKFINWGGAGNEGIFVCPPAGTIDAAHLNGVKILGTLF
ncbi:MAG: carbohydrate-binding protein, partial [Muribaculaceae bacterium]|nr:carbohydrate-binding protein [Muribaculaceae bacterium]